MAKNNIIDINGKRYDARTGAVLLNLHSDNLKPKTTTAMKPVISQPSMHDVVRHPAKHAVAHKPKPSKTLMRHAVKKPSASLKRQIRAQGPNDSSLKPVLADVVVAKSAKSIDPKRVARATKVPKSHLITHFSSITSDVLSPAAPAMPAPSEQTLPLAPIKAAKPKTTSELLDHAIKQASSHLEPAPRKSHHRRKGRTAAAAAVALFLLGFVGYQELPSIKLNVASAKAGFNANLPDYQPAGFSIGKLSYSPGIVATKFNSNSDARSYTITQKTSSWDSQALKDNFLLKNTADYQVSESGGRTIYLYGNGNATWVNGGVWYIVQSNGTLSGKQLVELATSV